MAQYPANIDLSSLDGTTGFKLSGEAAYDRSGWSVASAGDVNGDGFSDLIVGARTADNQFGASYVVFGKAAGFAANLNLSSLDGTTGFKLSGVAQYDLSGWSVASAGDVNGDGFADLIVGARGADPHGNDTGASYLVFGKAAGFAANIDLSSLDGTTGFKLSGVADYAQSGFSVASAGDVNGDGFADLIVGAPGGVANYVVFGKASGFAANIELSSLDGSNGFTLTGVPAMEGSWADLSGFSVASAGDVNGDGFADLIVGAPGTAFGTYSFGASYVVFGKASGFAANIDLPSLDGSNGFALSGTGAYSSGSVASAGDVNGDGFGDLIVGAQTVFNSYSSGSSYVVFGKASGFAANIDLSSLDGNNGFTLSGGAGGGQSGGFSVASAGDVNGDGFADLIVSAPGTPFGSYSNGASYVVFGKASGFAANIDLSSLDGSNGFKLSGVAEGDQSGWSVASAGDVNGDGLADLIVGAPYADPNGNDSGASYVVFGQLPDTAVNRTGTAASQNLVGGNFDDVLSGLGGGDHLYSHDGNDTLDGGTGGDVMFGGAGNDTYFVDDAGDVVTEAADQGTDEVRTILASYTLGTNVENLTGTVNTGQTLTGNVLANIITGDSGADTLDGGAGVDTLSGRDGNDTYLVDSSFEQVVENANEGLDTVLASVSYALTANVENITLTGTGDIAAYGNSLVNIMTGNSGNNLLDGGGAADFMYGGAGNDGYMVDSSFDQIFENAGEGDFDTVYASVSYALSASIENLFLQGTGNFQAIGNALSNVIIGNDGDNLMDGGAGIDGLLGGTGNDHYFIDNSFDQIVENANEGDFDTVYAWVDYQLGANLENLFMQGTANLAAYGNELSNLIIGNDGDNLLNGGLGIDGLIGGKGNDTYVIDNSFDQIVENANEGTDVVYASVSYQLGENLETLFLSGSAIQGYGNSGVNTIVGTAGNNGIDGRGGADVLTGNGGIDTFIFNAGEMNGDVIMDFDGLGAGAGDQLMFVGFGAGASLQQINATVWQIDYNGGASHEQFTLANGASLHASDFAFV
jgi:Ca2+-binding RTX toxin-like protein